MVFTQKSAVLTLVALAGLVGCTRSESSVVVTTPVATTATTSATAPATTASIAPPTQPPDPTTTPSQTAATPPPNPPSTASGGTATDDPAPTSPGLTEDAIRTAVDPDGDSESVDVLAWGDVDGDGDADAVVLTGFCGASCGTELDLVLDENPTVVLVQAGEAGAFAPWYNGGGAAQSSVTSATINGPTIVLTGTGLCGDVLPSETDEPGMCNYQTVRTATYQFANGSVQPVSIEPPPG